MESADVMAEKMLLPLANKKSSSDVPKRVNKKVAEEGVTE